MDFIAEFAKLGVVGLVAGVFLWLYLGERKDHQKTRDALIASYQARLDDSKKTTESITTPLSLIGQGVQLISDKIEIAQGRVKQ
jgi:hypothetical protein